MIRLFFGVMNVDFIYFAKTFELIASQLFVRSLLNVGSRGNIVGDSFSETKRNLKSGKKKNSKATYSFYLYARCCRRKTINIDLFSLMYRTAKF